MRRPVLAAVVAVAVLVAAGLVLGDDGSSGGDDAASAEERDEVDERDADGGRRDDGGARTTSTTRTQRTTTTTAPTTTVPPGPVLWGPTGAGLLTSSSSSGSFDMSWTWTDLDSGERRETELRTPDPWMVIPARGGVVYLDSAVEEAVYQPLPEGEPVPLGAATEVLATEDPTMVWLVRSFDSGGEPLPTPVAQLVRIDGTAMGGAISMLGGIVHGGTSQGLVFGAGGRTYVQGQDGTHSIGIGDLRDVQGTRVALVACDDRAACRPEVVDLATGDRTLYPPLRVADSYSHILDIVPGGGLVVSWFGPHGAELDATFYDGTGRVRGTATFPDRPNNATLWLPDGVSMLVPTRAGFDRVFPTDGEMRTTPVPRLDGLRAEWALVIPR